MICKTFFKLLRDYIAEELFQEVNELMTIHLTQCKKCKKVYNEELKAYNFVQNLFIVSDSYFISSREAILMKIDKTRYNKEFSNK